MRGEGGRFVKLRGEAEGHGEGLSVVAETNKSGISRLGLDLQG